MSDSTHKQRAAEDELQQARDQKLASRAAFGAVFYPVVFLMICLPTGFFQQERALSQSMLVLFCVLGAFRLFLCLKFDQLYPKNRNAWRFCFVMIISLLGLFWGFIAAYSFAQNPWAPASLFFLFSGSGLAGGMLASVGIDPLAYRLFLIGLLFPPGLTALTSQEDFSGTMAGFHIVYFAFLWVQGKKQSKAFKALTENTREILRQRDELESAKKKAEIANLAKTRLLANVNHELRTPMNAIVGATEWALGRDQSEENKELWEEVENASHQLLNVINQVLDFSKIDSGQLSEAKMTPFSLASCLKRVERLFSRLARKKNLELRLLNKTEPTLNLIGDQSRIGQILSNLVSNSLKFTQEGEVVVEANYDDGVLSLTVTDTGPGIPEHYHSSLFTPFSQADSSAARIHGGTGLGLAISKNLALSMGGELNFDAAHKGGCKFELSIKILVSELEETPASPAPSYSRDYKVLVVDDDPTNRRVAERQLRRLGMVLTLAESGSKALEICAKNEFDLIFMDLQMPGLDGIQVTKKLRNGSQNQKTPIIAFTAHTGDEERTQCFDAGMVAFLNKPLQKSVLVSQLQLLEKEGVLTQSEVAKD